MEQGEFLTKDVIFIAHARKDMAFLINLVKGKNE